MSSDVFQEVTYTLLGGVFLESHHTRPVQGIKPKGVGPHGRGILPYPGFSERPQPLGIRRGLWRTFIEKSNYHLVAIVPGKYFTQFFLTALRHHRAVGNHTGRVSLVSYPLISAIAPHASGCN